MIFFKKSFQYADLLLKKKLLLRKQLWSLIFVMFLLQDSMKSLLIDLMNPILYLKLCLKINTIKQNLWTHAFYSYSSVLN